MRGRWLLQHQVLGPTSKPLAWGWDGCQGGEQGQPLCSPCPGQRGHSALQGCHRMACSWPGDTLRGVTLTFFHFGTGFPRVLVLEGCASPWVSRLGDCCSTAAASDQLSTKLEGTVSSRSLELSVRVGHWCLNQGGGGSQQSSKFPLPPRVTLPARAPPRPAEMWPQHLALSKSNPAL